MFSSNKLHLELKWPHYIFVTQRHGGQREKDKE